MLAELAFQEAQGEGRAVDRDRPAPEEVRQGAEVILVAMGEQHGLEPVREGLQVGEVRHDGIDARLVVHQEEAAGAVDHQRVHAELAEPADGDQAQLVGGGGLGPGFEFRRYRHDDGNTSG